jgi:hypothetical protein
MHEEIKQEYGTMVAKKSERLVTALYLVTDLMTDSEPIKHGLRKNAVTLLSSMNALAQLDVKDRVIELKTSLKSVTEIISMLHVSITTGIVSEMNGQILMDGFRSLQMILEKKQPILTKEMLDAEGEDDVDSATTFSSAVTSTSYDVLTPLAMARLHGSNNDLRRTQESLRQAKILEKIGAVSNKGHITAGGVTRGTSDIKDRNKETEKDTDKEHQQPAPAKPSTHAVLMEHATRTHAPLPSSFQLRKLSRRDQILALFVRGVDVSIKDIAGRIKGCSEKTIQRELNSLLYDNLIERIGEKRWSRYVLK